MHAVDINDLFFAFENEEWVLEGINLHITPHQLVAIVGPNGGGKTTLLRLLMGLLKPSKGAINLFGLSSEEARQQIAYVPQILRCDRHFPLTVLDLVLQGCLNRTTWWGAYRERDKEAARAALAQVDLAHVAEMPFGSLSGGQAQRALIARALVSQPQILLLDEPTANVDKQTQIQIHLLLEQLKHSCTILMVTHDLGSLMPRHPGPVTRFTPPHAACLCIDRVLCIQKTLTELLPHQICQHFAIGLYHPPVAPT